MVSITGSWIMLEIKNICKIWFIQNNIPIFALRFKNNQ